MTVVTLTERALDAGSPAAATDGDTFDSITRPGNGLYLRAWRDLSSARTAMRDGSGHCRVVQIIRDYGMFARAEAPQYFPP